MSQPFPFVRYLSSKTAMAQPRVARHYAEIPRAVERKGKAARKDEAAVLDLNFVLRQLPEL
jgi:hypothetical protein